MGISVYNINEFEHNTITMNEGLLQTRVFEINNHRGCKLIDNNIKNAKYDDGSCVLLCKEVGKSSLSPLEISDCIFYNCHGSDIGSIMQIYNLDSKITIKNTTLQKTSNFHYVTEGLWPNKKTYYKGYFYQFQCNCNPAVAEFIGCHFLDLESNAQSGGGIGLLLTNDNDHELLFENTNFERITFSHPTYSGGAISFSSEVNQNQKTKVTVKGCLFNTVTSKNGGGAIYFNAPTKELTVENSRFINTYSNLDDIAKGGAIYVKHNKDSSPVTIKNCYFEETKSKYGGAIYIEWSSDSKSDILIDGCTFSKTRANSHGFAITIEKADSNEVTISNCNFNDCVDKKDFFVLNLDVSNLNFLYNNIVFSNKNECGGCIILEKIRNHLFNGNLFKNYQFDDTDTDIKVSGGINCFSLDSYNSFTFINNTFDNILGNNQGRCIRFIDIPYNKMTLRNNTVKNCLNGGPLFYFRFNNKIDDFIIESSNFIENSVSEYWNSDAESLITPQIWVENNKNGDHGTKLDLIFDHCFFNKNTCPNEGGAIHYGKGKSLFNTRVVFQNCLFNENTAKNGGSAIAIESYQGCEINNCTFTKNKSEDGQGTVYIKTQFSLSEPKENEILVTKCTFDENECKESHAIHIIESVNLIHISFCTFNDCGKNDYVVSIKTQVQSIAFENNTFRFTKFDTTSSAICLHSENFNLIGNTFNNIKNTVVRFYSDMKENKQFQLIENNFTTCTGDSIIDAENIVSVSPIIKGNRFEDISILSQLMILKLNNAINDIIFDNNTFFNININTESGGVGLEINHESTDVSFLLSFSNCIFINNNNKENKQQGSAISCNNYINRGNIRLSINNCLFEENHNNGKGCAVYVNIQRDITIEKCNFSNNIGLEKGSVYIDSDVSYTLSSSVSISQCNFNKNQVSRCSSIYIAPSTTKTIKIDFCTFEEEKGGLLFDNFKNTMEIKNCNFHNTLDSPALVVQHPKDSLSDSTITIIGCTFDSCRGIDNKCFDINSNTREFTFENNIIQNNRGTGHNNYFGTFNLNEKILTFSMYNISFINNICDSLYGGGIGIQFYGISQLTFYKCCFKENCAKQDTTISRPTQNAEQTYYNGDGGAIQIGYICTTNNVNVQFKECNFSDNHAERHGGAIAIQTTMIVHILDCIFENNLADYDFKSSSKLLTENHFHKKNEGRGGAIYINPSYTYNDDSLNCKSPDHFMQEVQIKGCQFVKNNAFDGYAIYVEGDDNEMPFTISNNKFIDNYNENNHNDDKNKIYGAVITTEITCIKENKVNLENIFSYSIPELDVRNISYVDHYGKTPSHAFSKSDAFTQSNLFPSMSFTESFIFSPSTMFSSSKAFSNSNVFPKTDEFSKSDYFTKSDAFMKTSQFSKSGYFTKSDTFSKSNQFSKSDAFMKTNQFSKSDTFSKSNQFSKSDAFMKTNPFSKSNYFTQSKAFSKSSQFSKSDTFSRSNQFSKSDEFDKTNYFSNSNDFTSSNKYTHSNDFTQSNAFSNSNTLTPIENDETSSKNDVTTSTSNEEYITATTIENSTDNLAVETQPIAITDTPTDAYKITETITEENRITDTRTAINDNKDPIITKEHSLIQETIEDIPTKQVTKNNDKQESLLVSSSDFSTNEEFGGGSDNSSKSSKNSNKSLIIGVVVGIVVLAIIIVLLIIFIIRKKRNSQSTDDNSANEMTSNENVISCTNSEIPEFDNPLFNNGNNQNDPFEQIFEEALV